MGDLSNKYNPLTSDGFNYIPYTGGLGNRFLADDGEYYSLPSELSPKGAIAVNTDFPLLVDVQIGWLYYITADVTDNVATHTNTGLSFYVGQDIYWNGTTWNLLGDNYTSVVGNIPSFRNIVGAQQDSGKTFQTTITDDDTKVPTSGAITDYALQKVLTSTKVWVGNGSNVPTETATVTSNLTVGDLNSVGLDVEANWENNLNTTIAGTQGDFRFGTGLNGTSFYCYYGQSGWNRVYTNPNVTDSTLIGELLTSGNWTNVDTYNSLSGSGDLMQVYQSVNYEFVCVDGTLHTWYRRLKASHIVTTSDIDYLPKPQIEYYKHDGDSFVIEASFDIISIMVEVNDTIGGTLHIGNTLGDSGIVDDTGLPSVVGQKQQLIYIADTTYPTINPRTMYIGIDTAASVTLHIVTQKLFTITA